MSTYSPDEPATNALILLLDSIGDGFNLRAAAAARELALWLDRGEFPDVERALDASGWVEL